MTHEIITPPRRVMDRITPCLELYEVDYFGVGNLSVCKNELLLLRLKVTLPIAPSDS